MIIECNGNTTEEKLKSLQESVQLALNNVEASGLQEGAKIGTIIIQRDGTMGGLIDGKYVVLKNLSADNIVSGTIDASQITVENIDANNITTGDINANRMQTAFADVINLQTKSINGHKIMEGTVIADALDDAVVTTFSNTNVIYSGVAPQKEDSTAPAYHPELKEGDMWYKTVDYPTEEGKPQGMEYVYVYSESTPHWTEKKLDAAMFTAGTITARELNTGCVTASKIAGHCITADELSVGVNNSITDAATTATNYLGSVTTSIANDGIKVFPSAEKNAPQNYVKIGKLSGTANDVGTSIYVNGNEVAKYGASKIELGKNSEASSVEMCGGMLKMWFNDATNASSITSYSDSLTESSMSVGPILKNAQGYPVSGTGLALSNEVRSDLGTYYFKSELSTISLLDMSIAALYLEISESTNKATIVADHMYRRVGNSDYVDKPIPYVESFSNGVLRLKG